jgi:putative ABC transport system substrate-binding protein
MGLLMMDLVSHSQTVKTMRRVGLILYSTESASAPYVSAFAHGMSKFGWEEGRNIIYRAVYPHGDMARLENLANDLVKERVDVIVVSSSPAMRVTQRATKTIPIVFTALSNVIGNGYVESLSRPGGMLPASPANSKRFYQSWLSSCTKSSPPLGASPSL